VDIISAIVKEREEYWIKLEEERVMSRQSVTRLKFEEEHGSREKSRQKVKAVYGAAKRNTIT